MKAVVANGSRVDEFDIISDEPVRLGEYVAADTGDGSILGMVEDSIITSTVMSNVTNYVSASEAGRLVAGNVRDRGYTASVKVLGLVDVLKKGKAAMPSLPAIPGTEVSDAPVDLLNSIFNYGIQVGSLLRKPAIKVGVDIDAVASRHLAILGTTGSGKSNLLALSAREIGKLEGTMIIFDYHGEYSSLKGTILVRAKINPKKLDSEELADVVDIRENASKQRAVLARAYTPDLKESANFWGELIGKLKAEEDDPNVGARVAEIIDRAKRRMGKILDTDIGDPIDMVKPNRVNVIDMSELTEAQSRLIISYYAREVLEERKAIRRGSTEKIHFDTPVVLAVEEAHTFFPAGKPNEAQDVASKVAREGRKFGVGLIVATQRPSRLDQDILSQMGSLAVLRVTQPKDQGYIVESSELMSEKVAANLPSLNSGEAMLLGQWVRMPTAARIDIVGEKLVGSDFSATHEWGMKRKISEVAVEHTDEMIMK